jgi:hypothetical protein
LDQAVIGYPTKSVFTHLSNTLDICLAQHRRQGTFLDPAFAIRHPI